MRSLLVRDLMTAEVKTVRADSTLAELLDLLQERNIRHVPVVDDDGELVGLVTQRDLLRRSLAARGDLPMTVREEVVAHRTVDEFMTAGVMTVDPDAPLDEAAELILDNKLGCLPVVEGQNLVGIITESDFVAHVLERSRVTAEAGPLR
jgi:CBS domain-containing protein